MYAKYRRSKSRSYGMLMKTDSASTTGRRGVRTILLDSLRGTLGGSSFYNRRPMGTGTTIRGEVAGTRLHNFQNALLIR